MTKVKEKKLTPKQKRFAKEYPRDLNGTKAAIRAGYSKGSAKQTASRIMTNNDLKETIQAEVDSIAEELGINTKYILGTIKDTMERCKQAKPVVDRFGKPVLVETDEGELVPAYTFDSNAVLKGAELLGKYKSLKIWTDKVEHSGQVEAVIKVEKVDLDERVNLLKGKP